jgi:uncharacterized membrane protein YraQ (UPF0718 family)
VINPITLLSTALAFQGNVGVVVARATMTLSVALVVGLLAVKFLGVSPRLGVATVAHAKR